LPGRSGNGRTASAVYNSHTEQETRRKHRAPIHSGNRSFAERPRRCLELGFGLLQQHAGAGELTPVGARQQGWNKLVDILVACAGYPIYC
jgi:hypothetical protein